MHLIYFRYCFLQQCNWIPAVGRWHSCIKLPCSSI